MLTSTSDKVWSESATVCCEARTENWLPSQQSSLSSVFVICVVSSTGGRMLRSAIIAAGSDLSWWSAPGSVWLWPSSTAGSDNWSLPAHTGSDRLLWSVTVDDALPRCRKLESNAAFKHLMFISSQWAILEHRADKTDFSLKSSLSVLQTSLESKSSVCAKFWTMHRPTFGVSFPWHPVYDNVDLFLIEHGSTRFLAMWMAGIACRWHGHLR